MVGIILLVVLVLIGIYFIGVYNSFVKMKNMVEEGFSTIDVYLKKRYDLIPNLVNTVKGYAKHESETLEKVIKARNTYATANSIEDKIANENMISGALNKLFSLSESYPDLKANTNFMTLQGDLKKIEEDLAQARKYYNGTVKNYNTQCETFPSIVIAKIMSFKKYPYFEIKNEVERENVKVEF
ncbi:MAG: LemA family protein [Fusobacteriaceae bacterium]